MTIYRMVFADRASGGDLWRYLRQRGRKRVRRSADGSGRGRIVGRVDISERPAVVEKKERIGDFEGDLVIGANHCGALVTLVDRASKFTLIAKVPDKSARHTTEAIIACLEPYRAITRTITTDNGKEFAGHAQVAQALDADFYFAKPYHSWERGLNEHTNGQLRKYFPKSMRLLHVPEAEVQRVEDLLNDRPRKSLDYATPREVFHAAPDVDPGG